MKDVSRRVVGYWEEEIVPAVRSGKRVLVAVRRCRSSINTSIPMLIYPKVQGPFGWSNSYRNGPCTRRMVKTRYGGRRGSPYTGGWDPPPAPPPLHDVGVTTPLRKH